MFTHDEMLSAVRSAGENGQPFTCGAVRDCLGVKSGDRAQMNQFHRRFRTFQKEAADEIEKVGKNAYRLKHPERAQAVSDEIEVAPEELIEFEIEIEREIEREIEPEVETASSPADAPLPETVEPPPALPVQLESMDVPLRMIEIDFDVQDLPAQAPPAPAAAPQPMIRAWLDRGQALGRRVAGFFGRA